MEEDRPTPLLSYAEQTYNPDPNSIPDENWVAGEDPIREVLNCVFPTLDSDEKRKDVIEYMQKLIRCSVGVEVFPYGSVPLKTYLPDGDIDLTALSAPNRDESLPHDVLAVLQSQERNGNTELELKDIQFIDAEVKLVKCLVQGIVIDVSFNQLGGLCTLCFLEQVDRVIGKDHLFKRSIMLIKTWCFYESRILGAHYGLISTYALEILVLYIFHVFSESLTGPLAVLYRFLDYYSNFDWDNYCISLDGPVNKSLLPNIVVENPVKQGTEVLLSGEFLKNCVDMFMVPSKGSETNVRAFTPKYLNIIDPLKENNNLGRSVHRGNFYRIRSALRYGARKLGEMLELPSNNVGDEVKKFFANTLQRHQSKCIPNTVLTFGTSSSSSSSEEANYEDHMHSKLSNADLDDYMSGMDDVSTEESTEATDLSAFRALSLNTADELPDLEGFFLDFRKPDAIGIGDTETLNPLADLTGDYDSHVRSLLYSQCCHGYALSAALISTTPPASLYGSREPWEVAVHPQSAPFLEGSSWPPVNPNGVVTRHAPYLTGHHTTRAGDTFHWEERNTVRGSRPYFPFMNSTRGRGRNRGPGLPIRQVQWARRVPDEMNSGSEAHYEGPDPREQSPPQGRGQPGLPSQVNSQRKLEFGSFGPLPEPTSDAETSQPCVVYGRRQGGFGIEPFHLKNEDEFPPLST